MIVVEVTVVPKLDVVVCSASTSASTVTWSDCKPTSSVRSSVEVSVTVKVTELTSAVLKPAAEKRTR